MNIYEKIQNVKFQLSQRELKKSGEGYGGFTYYELSDFLPSIIELCTKNGIFTHIDFDDEKATLTIIDCTPETFNTETGERKDFRAVKYSSPMKELEIKGSNAIQALGGTETYLRRYLYMNAFDIVEGDVFDNVSFDKEKKNKKETNEKKELIEKCKSEFAKLTLSQNDPKLDIKQKNINREKISQSSEFMKKLGYVTFKDVSKNGTLEEVKGLAKILEIDIPEEKNKKEEENGK